MPAKSLIEPIDACTADVSTTPSSTEQEGGEGVPSGSLETVERVWEFVKNMNPSEVIRFDDGTEFQFPRGMTQLYTANKELAEKLLAVASKYSIICNNP